VEKKRASSLLDYAIRRGPTLLLEDGQTAEALRRMQTTLRSVESHLFAPIRLTLCRRYVEVLLRHVWTPVSISTPPTTSLPKYYSGGKIFTPLNAWEDAFLLLSLAEAMVIRDGVLNQAPEFAKARKLANLNAASVMNLLALTSARWGQFGLVNESLDKTLKFSFEEAHIWKQVALSLHASNSNSRRSLATLSEAHKLNRKGSTGSALVLMAVKEAYARMGFDAGLDLAQKGRKMLEEEGGNGVFGSGIEERIQRVLMLPRLILFEGIGHFLKSFQRHIHSQRCSELDLSLDLIRRRWSWTPVTISASTGSPAPKRGRTTRRRRWPWPSRP